MFGGFDSEFFNDLHVLNLDQTSMFKSKNCASTIHSDYARLVNSQEHSNITFLLEPEKIFDPMQVVYANKALLLHRIFEKEIQGFASEKNIFCLRLEDALKDKSLRDQLPQFIVKVFDAKNGERIHLRGIK